MGQLWWLFILLVLFRQGVYFKLADPGFVGEDDFGAHGREAALGVVFVDEYLVFPAL